MFMPIFPQRIQGAAKAYLRILDRWNSIHSLTSYPPDKRFEALLLDSATLLPHLESIPSGSLIADFGSGMGIPAVVIAAYRADIRVVAIDRNRKKMAFVRQAAHELGLDNLSTACGSVESMAPLNAHFGTAKAVGPLNLLLGWWGRHSLADAPFFVFKGPSWNPSEVQGDWSYETHPYRLPNLGKRFLVKLTKNQNR